MNCYLIGCGYKLCPRGKRVEWELLGLGSVTKRFELVMLSCSRCVIHTVLRDLCDMESDLCGMMHDLFAENIN